jgi:hypothetical protein
VVAAYVASLLAKTFCQALFGAQPSGRHLIQILADEIFRIVPVHALPFSQSGWAG